jgi:RNA polymerase sigma factor (sigma-70 family)
MGSSSPEFHWPRQLRELHSEFILSGGGADSGRLRGELWLILNAALRRFLRLHARRFHGLSRADLEDLASEKSLDLLRRLDSGTWEIMDRTDAEIAGFLSKVARNGIVDLLRRPESRRRAVEKEPERARKAVAGLAAAGGIPPDAQVETRGFADALADCAGRLGTRSRRVWFFRVFLGLSTTELALHPDVALETGGVDMLLHRARKKIRDCMEQKGHRVRELPAGTFMRVWMTFHRAEEQRQIAHDLHTPQILAT